VAKWTAFDIIWGLFAFAFPRVLATITRLGSTKKKVTYNVFFKLNKKIQDSECLQVNYSLN
jgi:hypothetical protein